MEHPVYKKNAPIRTVAPSHKKVRKWIEDFFSWLFCLDPKYSNYGHFLKMQEKLPRRLSQLFISVGYDEKSYGLSHCLTEDKIQILHQLLEEDLSAVFEFDPAAKSRDEVLLSYPGFFAIFVHRVAHEFWKAGVPLLPRMLSEYAHGKTGIDIHPGARIGRRFFIDHGTGIVIGETAEIGDNVKIYQGVTLGALSVSKADAAIKRHPTVGNDVTIYANATILGAHTVIGDGAVIGGNVWLTRSVPPGAMVYHKSEISIKPPEAFPEPLNFVI